MFPEIQSGPPTPHVWTSCSVETLGSPAITYPLILMGVSFSLRDLRLGSSMASLCLLQWGPSHFSAQARPYHIHSCSDFLGSWETGVIVWKIKKQKPQLNRTERQEEGVLMPYNDSRAQEEEERLPSLSWQEHSPWEMITTQLMKNHGLFVY